MTSGEPIEVVCARQEHRPPSPICVRERCDVAGHVRTADRSRHEATPGDADRGRDQNRDGNRTTRGDEPPTRATPRYPPFATGMRLGPASAQVPRTTKARTLTPLSARPADRSGAPWINEHQIASALPIRSSCARTSVPMNVCSPCEPSKTNGVATAMATAAPTTIPNNRRGRCAPSMKSNGRRIGHSAYHRPRHPATTCVRGVTTRYRRRSQYASSRGIRAPRAHPREPRSGAPPNRHTERVRRRAPALRATPGRDVGPDAPRIGEL